MEVTQQTYVSCPALDFGLAATDTKDLRKGLEDQLRLLDLFDSSAGLDRFLLSSSGLFWEYRNRRSEAAGWFADSIRRLNVDTSDVRSLFLGSLNVMDRYVATRDTESELVELLTNSENVRAACFSLSAKMHATCSQIDLDDICVRNRVWANSTVKSQPGPNLTVADASSTGEGILRAEKDVLIALGGAAFPVREEDIVRLLVRFLALKRSKRVAFREPLSALREPLSELRPTDVEPLAAPISRAVDLLTRAALDIELKTRVSTWQLAAVCSLIGFLDVSGASPDERELGEGGLMALFDSLRPGSLTQSIIREIEASLNSRCLVCGSGDLHPLVARSLLSISKKTCSRCRKGKARGKTPHARGHKVLGETSTTHHSTYSPRAALLTCHETMMGSQ